MNLILFGFKSCGKTHFGKLLAKALNRPFIDTDDLIVQLYEKSHGQKISTRKIHQTLGEKAFREFESEAIQQLNNFLCSIIAVGGGTVLDPANVAFLKNSGQMIYLKASFATIEKRIFQGELPSVLNAALPKESLRSLFDERVAIYGNIPAFSIDVDALNSAQVIDALKERFYGL